MKEIDWDKCRSELEKGLRANAAGRAERIAARVGASVEALGRFGREDLGHLVELYGLADRLMGLDARHVIGNHVFDLDLLGGTMTVRRNRLNSVEGYVVYRDGTVQRMSDLAEVSVDHYPASGRCDDPFGMTLRLASCYLEEYRDELVGRLTRAL